MLHIFKDLLIIGKHLDLGGSDSDTPRSTLSVSDPSTSGTVGDLPHVSTSSSARDLPCSSTSSASNQEQSSLEEFSASTDSGLGGSDVSSETESPDSLPDEEDNLFEEEPSNAIYERHMYLKKHGFPLWIPQPNMRLSRSYRRQGVSIGDVGIFTSDGGFDFLFKVCLPAGHPNNPNELPEGFSFLVLNTSDVCEFRAHSSHSHMSSTSVQKQEATFECSGSDGAVLIVPQGAYHEDLKNISRFRDYALTHAESWYQYATGPRGREVGNGKLHMVTGCDKTTSWGIATYSHLQSKRPEGSVTLLKFEAVGNERRCQQSSYPTYAWNYVGAVEAKVGPEEDELLDLGVQSSAPLRNQCTFIRSLTPTLGLDDWERLQLKVAASAKDRALEQSPKNPFASVLGAISSLPGNLSSMCGYGRGSTSKLTDTVTPARALAAHPATYVTDMILQKCTKAKVVVVHDSDWCSVIRDSDDDWTYTAQDLPRRIQEAFDIMQGENGTVYLQEKLSISVSSLISVELEDEGRLLLEHREPGLRSISSTRSTLPPFMLRGYRISALWMIILFLIPQGVVRAGRIFGLLIYMHAILLGFRIWVHATCPRIEYHQAIISAMWIIFLSLIPQDLVRAGAILLGFLIYVHVMHPRILMKTLQLRLSSLEEQLQEVVDIGIMRQSDTRFTNQFTRDIGKIRYNIFELHKRTLMTSGGFFQEIKAVWEGLSLEIDQCIRDVDALKRDLEINRAKILSNQYHSWKLCIFGYPPPSFLFSIDELKKIRAVVRALHFERSNPNNVHENASAFANNIAN